MFDKLLMGMDHLKVQLMRDLVYSVDNTDYIALPGQAFPIFTIGGTSNPYPVSLWVYTAVIDQAGRFFLENGHFGHPGSAYVNQCANAPRPGAILGAPGGVRISHISRGLPGLPVAQSIDSWKPGITLHKMEGWDFVQMEGRCASVTTTGRRFMPSIYIENTSVTDKMFPDSCKYEMWIPKKGWFGYKKDKLEKREMICTDIPVMLTALEHLIPTLGYSNKTVDSMVTLYLSLLDDFCNVTRADTFFIGPEVLNGNDVPDLVTREEYNDIGSTVCFDRPTIARAFDKKNIWQPFEEDWFKLKSAFENGSFIDIRTRGLTPVW